jgi:hypothetical protein
MSIDETTINIKDCNPLIVRRSDMIKQMLDNNTFSDSFVYEGKKLYIQTPKMSIPYSIGHDKNKDTGEHDDSTSYVVHLPVAYHWSETEIKEIIKKLDYQYRLIINSKNKYTTKDINENMAKPKLIYKYKYKSSDVDS